MSLRSKIQKKQDWDLAVKDFMLIFSAITFAILLMVVFIVLGLENENPIIYMQDVKRATIVCVSLWPILLGMFNGMAWFSRWENRQREKRKKQ